MGPLELADFIGLDTCLSVMQVLHEGLADSKYRPCPLLVKYVEAGWLGRKTKRGFGRHADALPRRLQVLEDLGAGVGVIGEPRRRRLSEPGLRLVGIARVDVDRDDLEVGRRASPCSSSSAGISLRQGAHQVAQRLTSTVLPLPVRRAALGPPSRKARSGRRRRHASATGTRPPRRARAAGDAAAGSAAGRQARSRCCIAWKVPLYRRQPGDAGEPRPRMAARRRSVVAASVIRRQTWRCHEQQDVGRPLRLGPAAIMEEINASIDFDRASTARTSPRQGACRDARRKASSGADDGEAIAHGLDTIQAEIESGSIRRSRARSRTSI